MNIGLFFDDSGFLEMDFSQPYNGNPGIGGTEYMYLMLGYYMALESKKFFQKNNPFVWIYGIFKLPN